MAIFGLGSAATKSKSAKKKSGSKSSQGAEAKKMLAKMQAKKDAGDCPFC